MSVACIHITLYTIEMYSNTICVQIFAELYFREFRESTGVGENDYEIIYIRAQYTGHYLRIKLKS